MSTKTLIIFVLAVLFLEATKATLGDVAGMIAGAFLMGYGVRDALNRDEARQS